MGLFIITNVIKRMKDFGTRLSELSEYLLSSKILPFRSGIGLIPR